MSLLGDHLRELEWDDEDEDGGEQAGETHAYTCDDCSYRWKIVEPAKRSDDEMEDEDGNLHLEDQIEEYSDPVCPMCGSRSVTER